MMADNSNRVQLTSTMIPAIVSQGLGFTAPFLGGELATYHDNSGMMPMASEGDKA